MRFIIFQLARKDEEIDYVFISVNSFNLFVSEPLNASEATRMKISACDVSLR